ncbi:MAG: neutral/alkaline non-lysosomal ceramidase N-terminal domain-containing protein [Planctomycetes bacterium]|nr:neutral/alkaline non-lysosomal ceramidase N-terminal domain-containing protein [Planctomycetota bacterium]
MRLFGLVAIGVLLASCRIAVMTVAEPAPRRAIDAAVRCGAARVALPVLVGSPLGGYGARHGVPNRGVRDPVFARAIVLEAGDVRVAIASVDILLISADLRAHVCADLGSLGLDGFLLAATHDHSGPGGFFDNALAEAAALGGFDAARRDGIARAIADAVRDAASRVRPSRLRLAMDSLPQFAVNRRFRNGPTDPSFLALDWRDDDGATIATIVSYAAHPTVQGPKNLLVSGDFPGALCRTIEARAGGVALFLNAAAGDQGPVAPPGPGDDGDAAARLGEALASATLYRLSFAPEVPCDTLAAARATMQLASREPRSSVGYTLAPLVHPLIASLTPDETTMTALAIGPMRLVGFPCDFGAGPGKEVRALRRGRWVIPVSYADDYIGYCVDERSYRRGGYEAMLSFYGPGLDADLVDAADALLDALPP